MIAKIGQAVNLSHPYFVNKDTESLVMIAPSEMHQYCTVDIGNGKQLTTGEIWRTLTACFDGSKCHENITALLKRAGGRS